MSKCRNCTIRIHTSYIYRYDGHCLQCWNAGIPRLTERIDQLKQALKVLFDWYERDGSVGGADVAFTDAAVIRNRSNP